MSRFESRAAFRSRTRRRSLRLASENRAAGVPRLSEAVFASSGDVSAEPQDAASAFGLWFGEGTCAGRMPLSAEMSAARSFSCASRLTLMLRTPSLGTRAAPHGQPSVGREKHPHRAIADVQTKVFTAGYSLPIDANPPLPYRLARGRSRWSWTRPVHRLGDPSEYAVGPIEQDSVRGDGEFHWTRPPVLNMDLVLGSARWDGWLHQRARGRDRQPRPRVTDRSMASSSHAR